MQLTPNYKLKKPEGTDPVDIQDFNDNADLIDAALKKKAESSGGDISEMTVKTLDTITTEFPVPVAGESQKSFLGKVKKFFEDTKNWMTGVCLIGQIVNNCVTNNAKLPLSAAQGKALMDLYNVLNTNLEVMYDSEVITSQETIQSYAELLPADGKTYSKRYTGPSDRPDEDFGIVYITKYDDSLVIIRAFTFSKGRTYTRAKNNTWKGWVKGIASDDFSDQTVIGNRGVVTTNASQPLGLYINTDQKKISLYINSSLIGSFNYT